MPKVIPLRHNLDRRADVLTAAGAGNPDDLLTTRQMADWLSVSRQWLEIGRHMGYGPAYTTLAPKIVRYRRSDILAWLEERKHHCTAEYRPRRKRKRRGQGA
jgi:predicted DNA-binding transcriptional regulator AlpA